MVVVKLNCRGQLGRDNVLRKIKGVIPDIVFDANTKTLHHSKLSADEIIKRLRKHRRWGGVFDGKVLTVQQAR